MMKNINKSTIRLLFMGIAISLTLSIMAQNAPQLNSSNVKKVIAAMTLEEKASLVVGTGMNFQMPAPSSGDRPDRPGGPPSAPGTPPAAPGNPPAGTPPVAPAGPAQSGPVIGSTEVLVNGAAGTTFGIPRLGITRAVVADGPAGLRISPTRQDDDNTYYCTAFPVGTLLASTWNTELVNQVGETVGNEMLEYGIDVILGPGMNIQRNPLCGRNFEYYSEDPYVSGKMAAAMVNGVQSLGVGTSIKHFVANNAETNRNSLNVIVSERALREIYLEGPRIAIQEAQPWTVMSSYNKIDDTYTSESYDLLTNILRKDWGFKGYVMTDWFGGSDPIAQMKAGNDLLMPGNPEQTAAIIKAVEDGDLDEMILDLNVERILNIIVKGPRFKGHQFSNNPDLEAHALVTRQSATEGMVLLKNDSAALPLSNEVKKLAVFGNTSYDIIVGGTGSGDVNEAYSVSLVEGLQNAGYTIDENLQTAYEAYVAAVIEGRPRRRGFMAMMGGGAPVPELSVNESLATSMAEVSDAALITIGRNSGEGRDRSSGEGDFKLTNSEIELIKNVSGAFQDKGKKTIVILNVGGVVETASWKSIPDAILLAWQGGQETGNSIADIVSGKANPSGKLAITFPQKYEDVPSASTFPGKELPSDTPDDGSRRGFMRGAPAEDIYTDGIYVGYRYYETFGVKPSYEFGYGLSYTTFEYSNLKFSSAKFKKMMTVTVDIKNTGDVAGKEVVELYLSAPAKKLDKPSEELKGFAKTRLLQPGESQTLTFELDNRSLASFDPAVSAWIADAGIYSVKFGASSKDIRQTGNFELAKDDTVKKESRSLVPERQIDELKPASK
jgi:beta-glucosidase